MALSRLAGRLRAVTSGPRAVVGAVGFLTRFPVGHHETEWEAFCRVPSVMVVVAYPLGALAALPVVTGLPAATAAVAFPAWLVVLTGITHLDGLADLADAVVVHGDSERRLSVMRDTTVGVGAIVAVVLSIAALALAAAVLRSLPWQTALGIVVAAEVGAKLGMTSLVAFGTATHDGLGSSLTGRTGVGTAVAGALFVLPAVALGWEPIGSGLGLDWPLVEGFAALCGAVVATLAVSLWAESRLGGVTGDVFGATNELARVLALHAGVVAWTL